MWPRFTITAIQRLYGIFRGDAELDPSSAEETGFDVWNYSSS